MRTRRLFLLSILLGGLWAAIAPAPAQDDGFYWLSSYSDALKEARRTGKPIFLEFRCEP